MGKLLDRFVGNIGPAALMVSVFFWSWFDLVPFGPVLPAASGHAADPFVLALSLLVSACVLFALFRMRSIRKRLLEARTFALCSLAFGSGGALAVWSGAAGSVAALSWLGAVLMGIYQAIGILVVGSITMCQGKTNALIHMASCLPFNIVFVLLGMFLRPGAAVVLCAVLPCLSALAFKVFLVRGSNLPTLGTTAEPNTPAARPHPGALRRTWAVYITLLLLITASFGLVNCRIMFFGPSDAPDALTGYASLLTRGLVAFAVFFGYVSFSQQPYAMLRAALFLMAGGLLALALIATNGVTQLASCTLFYAGFAIFDLLIWAILVIMRRAVSSSAQQFICLVMALDQLGIFIGTAMGAAPSLNSSSHIALGIAGVLIALFATIALSERNAVADGLCIAVIEDAREGDAEGRRVRSHAGTPDLAAADAVPAAQPPASPGLANAVERIAAQFFLTKKESDTLTLLAAGRSTPYIAEALCVSPNTVKTHVRHIYAKLDIHNRQELIDVLEHGCQHAVDHA